MYRCYLIALLLVIFLVGCTAPPTEQIKQDPIVTPEGIRITPYVVYGHKFGMTLTFDMYQPKNQNGAGVILIDSGGWYSIFLKFYTQTAEGIHLATMEELETMMVEKMRVNLRSFNIEPLLAKGFTVFSVRHSCGPKFEMSEIANDLRRAVRFIRFQAEEYGIDSERLGLWGGSAGGHLSLLLATTPDIANPQATEEFDKDTGRVAAVVAYYPPTNLKRFVDFHKLNPIGNTSILDAIPALNLEDDQYSEFSPINFVSADDPPTLIIHGDKDPGVPIIEGQSMHQELLKAGVESKFVTIPDAGHGFEGEDADHALAEAISWFEEHLLGK